jgi:hypothetical protein
MPQKRLRPLLRIALAVAFTAATADRAAAGPILVSDLQVDVDLPGLMATVSVGLQPGEGGEVFLDELAVSLFQDGVSIDDLLEGAPLVDFDPFFSLARELPDAGLPVGTILFRITGLALDSNYTGLFALSQFDSDFNSTPLVSQAFEFSTVPAAVPEPATLLLMATGLGATGWLERRRRSKQG